MCGYPGLWFQVISGGTPASGPCPFPVQVPGPFWGGGGKLPSLWSHVSSQLLVPDPFGGGYPSLWSQVPSGGIPDLTGVLPSQEWGIPTSSQDWGTPPPPAPARTWVPPPSKDRLSHGWYASCGFLQQDFPVSLKMTRIPSHITKVNVVRNTLLPPTSEGWGKCLSVNRVLSLVLSRVLS